MHQKGRVDLYNSGTSSHFLGQGCCWLAWEKKASPKHRSLFKKFKVIIKALWSQSTGPHQAWPGCGLSPYILLYLTSKQTIHFFLHPCKLCYLERENAGFKSSTSICVFLGCCAPNLFGSNDTVSNLLEI